jgi:hypothetical protein
MLIRLLTNRKSIAKRQWSTVMTLDFDPTLFGTKKAELTQWPDEAS